MSDFFDTCALLKSVNHLMPSMTICSVTLEELENIKTSTTKDADIKYAARAILRDLDEHPERYSIIVFTNSMLAPINEKDLPITNDTKILACALSIAQNEQIAFYTNDYSLKAIARLFPDQLYVMSIDNDWGDYYKGFFEMKLSDTELAALYSYPEAINYNLKVNEYVLVYNWQHELVDKLVYTGEGYRPLSYKDFDSEQLGCIRPLSNDPQQQFVADSFTHNKITLVKGPAGSGKTLLSLGFLFNQLEKHKIDKIIVFCNTVAAMHAAKLGYYPGTKDEKLLDSQIGNLLISKLGSRAEVERLIGEEKLVLLPMSDIRGYDTTGMRAGIYISEAQNLDIPLMKLALQRIGDDSICIIDGDAKAQVDDINFAGSNNGLRRVSQVFRGQDFYGEVELQQVHRSKIGMIAENM